MGEVTQKIIAGADQARNIFGEYDSFAKRLEGEFSVAIVNRDDGIKVTGENDKVTQAVRVLKSLLALSGKGHVITSQDVDYTLEMSYEKKEDALLSMEEDIICHTATGRPVHAKTLGQQEYVDAIRQHMITFGLGPAGTGKTYLGMAMAISAFKKEEVGRIILTRPAIEAGEKLGFLPGDLQSKVDPYLRPLYDALYQIMGPEHFSKNMEKGLIEVAPLAYMRGRTLDNAYIILDEAQNTTPAQMKMFLTRIGFGSKVIVTGDISQKDLPAGTVSGLDVAVKVLSKVDGIAFCRLGSRDVVRHPLVQRIVRAYDDYESREQALKERSEASDQRSQYRRGDGQYRRDEGDHGRRSTPPGVRGMRSRRKG